MAKRAKTRRGRVPSQNAIIDHLDRIAGISGYVITSKSLDKKTQGRDLDEQIKDFRPDLIIEAYKGNRRRVYEVEKTITNNTIFKSLVSLLYFLGRNPNSEGTLVVPDKKKAFAEQCLSVMSDIIRNYDRGGRGAPIKIRITVISFNDVLADARRIALCAAPRITEALQSLLAPTSRQVVQLGDGNFRLTDLGSRRIRENLADKLTL
jgi:hypothetical protein